MGGCRSRCRDRRRRRGKEGVEGEQKIQTNTVKLGEVQKIMPPLKERTHCPRKHECMKSNTQGQCVHMKKRIMMIPRSTLLKQQCENAQSMQKKTEMRRPTTAGGSSTTILFFFFSGRIIFLTLFRG